MRLTPLEIVSIQEVFKKFRLANETLYLFGSRLNEEQRGGDIDLLVIFNDENHKRSFLRLDFIINLKKLIGERKIDLTLATEEEMKSDSFLISIAENAEKI